jgi:conjugal transfer pilus assembly protein TraE
MNFNAQQHRFSQLTARFNLMVALVFGLLITNVLMGGLAFYTSVHQRVEITPFIGGSGYVKSDAAVDTHYLYLMSENFIYSRLNVTPETVRANQKRLLAFVDSAHFSAFSAQLEKEAKVIIDKKISSHFEISDIRADSNKLGCTITGVLKRAVGLRDLRDERLTYTLQYRYRFGRLTVTQFTHVKDTTHA